jgi:hypothetical protein
MDRLLYPIPLPDSLASGLGDRIHPGRPRQIAAASEILFPFSVKTVLTVLTIIFKIDNE